MSLTMAASVRRQLLDRDLARASSVMRGRVLEIGAGRAGRRGTFVPPTESVSRWWYLDADARRGPHIAARLEALPFGNARFDTVVCLEVLEYVWDVPRALAECARVLAPGGSLVLSTPFVHRVDAEHDYWRFSEPALRRLCLEAGLQVDRLEAQGHAFAAAVNVARFAMGQATGIVGRVAAGVASPLVSALLAVDASSARHAPPLTRFTTGYLLIASLKGSTP